MIILQTISLQISLYVTEHSFSSSASGVSIHGVGTSSFHYIKYGICASSPCSFISFMYFVVTSLHLNCALPVSGCSATSIFSLQHLAVFLYTCPNHICLTSHISSRMFVTPVRAIICSVLILSIIFAHMFLLNNSMSVRFS